MKILYIEMLSIKIILSINLILLIVFQFKGIHVACDHDIEDHVKIEFIYEILEHVEYPVRHAKWRECGKYLSQNKIFYKEFNDVMLNFYNAYQHNGLLARNATFCALVVEHQTQLRGLYEFLYQPINWQVFVQNACWARHHLNAHMFVVAFTTAIIHRSTAHAIFMPRIQEILPRYFLQRDLIESLNAVEIENEQLIDQLTEHRLPSLNMNAFKPWQWWKLMGYNMKQWHGSHKVDSSIEKNEIVAESPAHGRWWQPCDYTRETQFFNVFTKVSYLSEDMDWNAYWYYLNSLYARFLGSSSLSWSTEERGEYWLYCVEQLLARYNMELLSLGIISNQTSFPAFSLLDLQQKIESGYQPNMIDFNGSAFQGRNNSHKIEINNYNIDLFNELQESLQQLFNAAKSNIFIAHDYTRMALDMNDSIAVYANLLQANLEAPDQQYYGHWFLKIFMLLSSHNSKQPLNSHQPNALLNFETMLRDPLTYIMLQEIVGMAQQYRSRNLTPYNAMHLETAQIKIKTVEVSRLSTYFALHDLEVSNLRQMDSSEWDMNGKFPKQRFFARQQRLTHNPFHFNLTIQSYTSFTAVLRVFLAPLQDVYDQVLTQPKFMELLNFRVHLKPGLNRKTIQYDDHFPLSNDELYSFDLYRRAKLEDRQLELDYDGVRFCGMPSRLLLPKGWPHGMPMKMFFIINEDDSHLEHLKIWWHLCLPLDGGKNFGYPFDRASTLDRDPLGANMFLKNVKIYHTDSFVNIET